MLQPTQVLRSNAPPLKEEPVPESNFIHHTSRILQEQSGNRQLNDYTSAAVANGYQRKYGVSSHQQTSPTENNWPAASILTQPHRPQYYSVPAQAHHSQPYVRQSYGYGSYQARGYCRHISDQQIDQKARMLWKHFQNSESYRKYRAKQQKEQKDEKNDSDHVWPEHLEKTFVRALVQWPPMGRAKLRWKNELYGRNELIADFIETFTGKTRDRKQVSSHIQVIKPFFKHDPFTMQYFSTKDLRHAGTHHRHHARNFRQSLQTDVSTARQQKHQLDLFAPRSFSMFAQRKVALSNHEEQIEKLHTYTINTHNPLGPEKHFQDQAEFESQFPLLATMDKQAPLECNIVLASASFAFPTGNFRDKTGIELGISFVCSSRHLSPTATFKYRTTFYQAGCCLDPQASNDDQLVTGDFQPADDGSGCATTSMKFRSEFWANRLSRIATKLKTAHVKEGLDPRQEASQELAELSAMQEVFLPGPNGKGGERILVMLWHFQQSTAETGQASWRRLVLPPRSGSASEALALASQYPNPRNERVDSVYDYANSSHCHEVPVAESSASQPALQSPFEYNEGTALPSATWPPAVSDSNIAHSQPVPPFDNNDFDFNGGNINLAFDPNSIEYGTFDNAFAANAFDSTAFDFDATGAQFVQDPALEQLTGQWHDASNTANTYHIQPDMPLGAVSHDGNYGIPQAQPGDESQPVAPQRYGSEYPVEQQYEQQAYSAAAPGGEEAAQYEVSSEQQAFGGAGQDRIKEDNSVASADASYLVRGVGLERQ
ncbi:TEA-domain-containing protein [Teratosphaeria nubilosa]|uniref:TEA-domain-containing protein n=1 Tax=Teratosphaeria nubilosa TaxID=161662 RepID=A0A6G1KYH3_9PEZI|nr:TEA-domain-containing protein [Teratosphaeria nubilosa]